MMDRIREVLCFEANRCMVQMVRGKELYAWFRRAYLQDASAGGVLNPGGQLERGEAAIQHKIVIVSPRSGLKLINPRPNAHGFGEIERCSVDASDFASGDHAFVDRSVTGGGQPQNV